MTFFFRHLIFLILMLAVQLQAQNLVPNGSFEEYVDCPIGLPDLQAVGWFQARGTCDYYNACASPETVGVPQNVLGWQAALTGEAYAGMGNFRTPNPEYREHLSIELIEPLIIGEKYHLSFYVAAAFNGIFLTKASNGQGALLSTVPFSADANESPINEQVQLINYEMINDTLIWHQIKGSFIADSAYSHLVLGCFLNMSLIDTSSILPSPFGEAYTYVDEVRLSTDSLYVNINLATSTEELNENSFNIYPNPSSGVFFINSNRIAEKLRIFDLRGALVMELEFPNISSFSLLNFENGLYIIELEDQEKRKSHVKVIKYH